MAPQFIKHQCRPITRSPCRMSNLKNGRVALLILRVKGHISDAYVGKMSNFLLHRDHRDRRRAAENVYIRAPLLLEIPPLLLEIPPLLLEIPGSVPYSKSPANLQSYSVPLSIYSETVNKAMNSMLNRPVWGMATIALESPQTESKFQIE